VIRLRAQLKAIHVDLGYREGDPSVRQKYMRKKPQIEPQQAANQ
jgi:hypothetical protein